MAIYQDQGDAIMRTDHIVSKRTLIMGVLLAVNLTLSSCGIDLSVKIQDQQEAHDQQESQDEAYILFTSDVHCGIDEGFGYAGVKQIRDTLEAKGCETILVDDGDFIQGESVGTLTGGKAIIDIMNDLHYDVVIPGNHEFDYGMDTFNDLVKRSEFPYISCNFTHNGELVFEPYIIKELMGHKIGFVGVTTPTTLTESDPTHFQDEDGNTVYSFMQDESGAMLYDAVQKAVDSARSDGAELVYLIAHLGNESLCSPWTYADVVANTTGIDVVLDGHSHDTEQVVMDNKDGKKVTRSAVGTKLNCVGYSIISKEDDEIEVDDTGIWSWPNEESAPELFDIQNIIRGDVDEAKSSLARQTQQVVARTDYDLTAYYPDRTDSEGDKIRMVRREETNLGDLCADAYRDQTGADIAFINGGGIRADIEKGDITYGDIINVQPFENQLCVIEVTGQQIADALEWGSRVLPDEDGGFLQVSGLTYDIDTSVPTPCIEDDEEVFAGIKGKRRVGNIKAGGRPLDMNGKYSLASHEFMLFNHGDGFTMFDDAAVLKSKVKVDNQALIDYIVQTLGGNIGSDYSDPYGQGRITISE